MLGMFVDCRLFLVGYLPIWHYNMSSWGEHAKWCKKKIEERVEITKKAISGLQHSVQRIEKNMERMTIMMANLMVSKGKTASTITEIPKKAGSKEGEVVPLKAGGDRSKFKQLEMSIFYRG